MRVAPLGKGKKELMGCRWVLVLVTVFLVAPERTFADHTILGVPPQFTMEPPTRRVVPIEEGGSAILSLPCGASGTPPPTITWFRETEQLGASDVTLEGRLSINVTRDAVSRAGTIYYCVATNRIGPDNSTIAALRSRNVTVSLAYFDGFRQTEPNTVEEETLLGGSVALECDFQGSNPSASVQWFMGTSGNINTPVNEISAENEILYLEGGRYLYIRELTATQRQMRFQCEVSIDFLSATRAPTVYTINTDITTEGVRLYIPPEEGAPLLGTQVVEVGGSGLFVYAAASRTIGGAAATLGLIGCQGIPNVLRLFSQNNFVVLAELDSLPDEPEIEFRCTLVGPVPGVAIGRIIVSDPPEFTPPQQMPDENDREVVVGDDAVVYSCVASGVPAPTITWYYNGAQELGSGVVTSNDGTLTIAQQQTSNSGIYQCVVSNQFGVMLRRWTLEVREPVFPVISPLPNTTGAVPDRRLGNIIVRPSGTLDVVISVVVESDPCPMVAWRFEGRTPAVQITQSTDEFILNNPCSGSSPYNFTLTIANLTSSTSGAYSANFTVQNTVVPLPKLYVTVPTTDVLVQSLDVMVETDDPNPPMCLLEGSNVVFTCVVDGFPRPQILFRKVATVIEPGVEPDFTRVERLHPDQIRINNIEQSDEARYSCEAVFDGMTRNLNPTPPEEIFCSQPVINAFTATQDPQEGEAVELLCMVEGTPEAVVTWRKDGDLVEESDGNILISVRPDRLQIRSATPEDSGVYECRASNAAGEVASDIRIEVQANTLADAFTTEVIIGIAAGVAGLLIAIVLIVLLLMCVYFCARKKSGSADFTGYSYPAMTGDGRGNVDADSYDGGQPEEAFEPDYDSVPTRRPNEPPPYKDTPGYQHGAPLAGDELEMIKYPPQDSESFIAGVPPYQRPSDNGYRPTPNAEDFLSEDAQFV